MAEMLKTVEIKVTGTDEFKRLLVTMAGEFDALPPNTKIRFVPFLNDLQKECDGKLQARQVAQ